jgi:hypothetical protein
MSYGFGVDGYRLLSLVYKVYIVCQQKSSYTEAMELIAIRVPEDMKAELEKIAEEQHRPLSNLVRLILMKWLETQHAEQEGKSK